MIFKNKEGKEIRHLQSAHDSEFTLCGIAFDCNMKDDETELNTELNLEQSNVNCRQCLNVIHYCKKFPKSKESKNLVNFI